MTGDRAAGDLATVPVETTDPVNAAILAVSGDRLQGASFAILQMTDE